MFYHLSTNLDSLGEKTFIPKTHENSTYNKVRVSDTIEGAIKGLLNNPLYKDILIDKSIYLAVYEVKEEQVNYITPNKLQYEDEVPNAKITGEHWVTDMFKSNPYLIRVNKIGLHKDVNSLSYEKEVELFDRSENMKILKKKDYISFISLCKKHNMLINKAEVVKTKLSYITGVCSKRIHSIYNVDYIIPGNISAKEIWIFKSKVFALYQNRKLNYYE